MLQKWRDNMNSFVRKIIVLLVLSLVLSFSASSAFAGKNRQNIVDTAVAAGQFNTLVAALEATGLDDVLRDESTKFTVFAPTDDAFAALGEDTINALLADPDTLADILLYHVEVGTGFKSGRLLGKEFLQMGNGVYAKINVDNGSIFINESEVVIDNILTTNGIIHVIDAVLLPPENVLETARNAGVFNTLVAALEVTGLDAVVADENTFFTVFAPTDAAFEALGEDTINALIADPDALANILLYHVKVDQFFDETKLSNRRATKMATGDPIFITKTDTGLVINDSNIVISNIVTRNGLIHVIDAVLIPPAH